ncbi:MAG: NADH-quinone oxidoreductase subunit C [Melioribacteraceae bacterium]|nr:MAG: NADH-quinone oxidoreductase subunit C [Melioribacteraceae bacterium]
MKTPEEIFELLKNKFGEEHITFTNDQAGDPYVTVAPEKFRAAAVYLSRDAEMKFDSLMLLSGVDDANGEKSKDENENEIITGGTLSVYYNLFSLELRHKVTVRVSVPRENPEIESITDIWRTADWHEREAYDMFGIIFKNHPDLRRILMPYDWDAGYPLRKDYQNPEFYHGMKVPY